MTKSPFDQLAKQYLEEFLSPFGKVERQYEIPGEAKFVDVWFIPDRPIPPDSGLGLLGRMVQVASFLEAFHNCPTRREMKVCLMELFWLQESEQRKAGRTFNAEELPRLWILAATTTPPLIKSFKGEETEEWLPGMYELGDGLQTQIVAIDQLPVTEETLWLRILGRDETLEGAVREVLALPPAHPRRNGILKLLASWRVTITTDELAEFCSRPETRMVLSEAYIVWEREIFEQGIERERSLILRQLARRVGELPSQVRSQVEKLPIEQAEALGEALLDFSSLEDLTHWLGALAEGLN
jgi:hypothetical protein